MNKDIWPKLFRKQLQENLKLRIIVFNTTCYNVVNYLVLKKKIVGKNNSE